MPAAIVAGDPAVAECSALPRDDFPSFCRVDFPRAQPARPVAANWHFELIAGKLAAVRAGQICRVIVGVPPRPTEVASGSVAFPAWCLGHDPSAQIVCVSCAQRLADKLSRDCRRIVASGSYQRLFPTRLSPQRRAVPEFETTAQASRVATSVGGVLTRRRTSSSLTTRCSPEEALSQAQRQRANEWYDGTAIPSTAA
jgi:hypothetical protein